MTGLLDTNVALYLLGGRLAKPMPVGNYGISVITEMELLAWPSLSTEDEKKVRDFVAQLTVYESTSLDPKPGSATSKGGTTEITGCDRLCHRP